jgi:hypothetical protein
MECCVIAIAPLSPSSFSRTRLLGGAAMAVVKPQMPVPRVEGLRLLWRTANSEQQSGMRKATRIHDKMSLIGMSPTRTRRTHPRLANGDSGGWWENEYEDLEFC